VCITIEQCIGLRKRGEEEEGKDSALWNDTFRLEIKAASMKKKKSGRNVSRGGAELTEKTIKK